MNRIGKTKKNLINELNLLIDTSVNYTLSLFDLLQPIFIDQIDMEFIKSHQEILLGINNKNINKYILKHD